MTEVIVSSSLTVYTEKFFPYWGNTFGSALTEQLRMWGLRRTIRCEMDSSESGWKFSSSSHTLALVDTSIVLM